MSEEEQKEIMKEMSQEEYNMKKKEEEVVQTKVSIEVKLSRNFNTITFGLQDEPLFSRTEEEFRARIRKKARILREEAEAQLKLIGSMVK